MNYFYYSELLNKFMTKTILILAANPIGEEALSVGSEMKALRKLLQPNFKVELSLETSWDDFNEELLRCNPDVVHFVGHGESKNGLVLEDGDGNGAGVTGDRLAALFKLFPQVECVVMNACQTEKVAAAIHPYVPCVIGMSQSIADEAAREFSLAFYQAVLQEKGYVWAFEFGKVRIASGFDRLHPTLLMREKPIVENLEAPGGRMSVESRLYVDRPMAEEDASREVLRSGALIRIKGPVEFGKSSLMARVVMKAEEQGAKTVSINFREIVPESLVSLKVFLRFFCTIVSRKLKFENQVQNYFDSGLGEMMECAEYFEDYLLPQISSSLVLELDEVDVLLHEHLEKGWVVDFFSMLRAWYDSKMNAHSQWKKLRIVLVHSREVNHETLNQNKSPFKPRAR